MPTNRIALRTIEEFMADYTPVYQPIYPLFMGKSAEYDAEVGKLDFRRMTAIGDIRAKHITPKDTEIRQVSATDARKSFKKYFLANQFRNSDLQTREGVEELVSQVLDEHQIQADELLLLGDGTSNGNQLNNGLYFSSDPNYTLESSVEIASGDTRLYNFVSKVTTTAQKANQVAGRKLVIFYGSNVLPLYNGLFDTAVKATKTALQEVLGPNYSFVQLPEAATPSGAHGWMIANLDQCKLHHTLLPQLYAQGDNAEMMYLWFNFLMGSMMLEVLAKDGIIRQPATLAS